MRRGVGRQGPTLYSVDWAGTLFLILILFLSLQQGRTPAPTEPETASGPLQLVPRDPGAYLGSLAGRRVVIDPGHGGPDAGSRGLGPQPEKEVVLQVAWQTARLLQQAGARPTLTRQGDELPGPPQGSLAARVELARRSGAEVFVSLHADSHPDPAVQGVTVYYYRPDSLPLARAVHDELVAALGAQSRGVRRAEFYVLRTSPVPSILVELGYLTHPQEAVRLADAEYQLRAAAAVVEGLARYFASRSLARRPPAATMGEDSQRDTSPQPRADSGGG